MDKTLAGTPDTDEWWFRRCYDSLHRQEVRRDERRHTRQAWLDHLWKYYVCEFPLPGYDDTQKKITRAILRMARNNFASLAVDAKMNRIQLLGIQVGSTAEAEGNTESGSILTTNGPVVHDAMRYAAIMGTGYLLAGGPDSDGIPVVTAEDPRQCITIDDALGRRPQAGLKVYTDREAKLDIGHLYLPENSHGGDRVRIARRRASNSRTFSPSSWEWDTSDESGPLPVQGQGVPLEPIYNRDKLGDFETHLDLLNRIFAMVADRLWTSKFQLFRQRALEREKESPDIPETDAHGNKVDLDDVFAAGPDALWELPPGYKIWESTQYSLQDALSATKDDVKEFAAVTQTPLRLYLPDVQAAEDATFQREGVVFKAEDHMSRSTKPVLRTMRRALAYVDVDVPLLSLQAQWGAIERYGPVEKAGAAVQAKAAGMPWESRMTEIMQVGPQQLLRMKKQRRDDELYAAEADEQQPA